MITVDFITQLFLWVGDKLKKLGSFSFRFSVDSVG